MRNACVGALSVADNMALRNFDRAPIAFGPWLRTAAMVRRKQAETAGNSDDRGRHSTTSRQLFCLPAGGILIDTPGMRELQLWDAEEGIGHAFRR